MDIDKILITQLSFFKEEALKTQLFEHGKIVDVEQETILLSTGVYVKSVPILLSGLIKVVREEGGKEMLLYHIYPLESCIVSIHCGINDLKSTVKAISEEQSSALLVPAHLVGVWQKHYPSFNNFILNLYQKRFYDVLDAFDSMAFHNADKRLLDHLQSKVKSRKDNRIEATHQVLGDELGVARETVSRLLKKLEADGVVRLHRGWIEVLVY